MDWSRRRMLKAAGALVGTGAVWSGSAVADPSVRYIALRNVHTGERLELEYFRDGAYLGGALAAIEVLLRDVRTDEQCAVDPKLLDYLVDTAARLRARPDFGLISGYRSQAGERSHSLHAQGRAIDVSMSDVDSAAFAAGAASLKRGGVGYYRASNFVHLDTGAFRTWRG
jgi:uncharacterized protein YcbK (DUF882 family)